MMFLPESFYLQEVTQVARSLLGMRLVRMIEGQRVSGIITETEAYRGEEDLACHAHFGRTKRNEVMYGKPGKAYVYFTYGMHWLLNAVTGEEGYPAAVLIRSIHPEEGLDVIKAKRDGRPQSEWCNGPAKICQALNIDGSLNGIALTNQDRNLWIEEGKPVDETFMKCTARIGLGGTPEPWKSQPWRFLFDMNEVKKS